MSKYHWNEAKLFKFLRIYKSYECLWNPYSLGYRNYEAKTEAFSKILFEMNTVGLTINECLSQIKHLHETYEKEHKKLKNIEFLGGRCYSNLLWYPLMNGMLSKVVKDAEKLSQEAGENLELVKFAVSKRTVEPALIKSRSTKNLHRNIGDNKHQINSINNGDHFVNHNRNRNHLSNEHIGSCPTCGYSINICRSQGDELQSQIVSYNRPNTSYNYKNRISEVNSIVKIPVSQKEKVRSCLMKSCSIFSNESGSDSCHFEPNKISNNRKESLFNYVGKGKKVDDGQRNRVGNLIPDSTPIPMNKNNRVMIKNVNWRLKKSKITGGHFGRILGAKSSLVSSARNAESSFMSKNNVDNHQSTLRKKSKSITGHNLVKTVLDFLGKSLNDSDDKGSREDRFILKKVVNDLRAAVKNDSKSHKKKIVKSVDKMICWREPVEEICHIISPCKSIGSHLIDGSNIKGGILTTRQRSACFRMIAGSDSGIEDTMNQFDSFHRLESEEKCIRNREACVKNAEHIVQSSVHKKEKKDEGIYNGCKNEESQRNSCPDGLIEENEKYFTQFKIIETRDETFQVRNISDENLLYASSTLRDIVTTDNSNRVETMRNFLVEIMAENLGHEKGGVIEEEVVNKITEILRESLEENGYAIERNYKFVTNKNVKNNDRRFTEDEAMWKIELKKIVADLLKIKKNGNPISFKVKTIILPPVTSGQANGKFFIEDGMARSDENFSNIHTKSSDFILKEETNGSIHIRDKLLFNNTKSVTTRCDEKFSGLMDETPFSRMRKNGGNENKKRDFSEWESLSDSNDDERVEPAMKHCRRRNVSSLYSRQNRKRIRDKKNFVRKHFCLQDSGNLFQIINDDEYSTNDHRLLHKTYSALNAESIKDLFLNRELREKIDKISETIKIILSSDKRRQFITSYLQDKLSTNNSNLIQILNQSEKEVIDRDAADKCLQTSVSNDHCNGTVSNLCKPICNVNNRLRLCEIIEAPNKITSSEINARPIDAHRKLGLKNVMTGHENVKSESKSCQTEYCWQKNAFHEITNLGASNLEKPDIKNAGEVDINNELIKGCDQSREKGQEHSEICRSRINVQNSFMNLSKIEALRITGSALLEVKMRLEEPMLSIAVKEIGKKTTGLYSEKQNDDNHCELGTINEKSLTESLSKNNLMLPSSREKILSCETDDETMRIGKRLVDMIKKIRNKDQKEHLSWEEVRLSVDQLKIIVKKSEIGEKFVEGKETSSLSKLASITEINSTVKNVEENNEDNNAILQSDGAARKSTDNVNAMKESCTIDIQTHCQEILDRVHEDPRFRNTAGNNNSNYYLCCRESTEVDLDTFVDTVASQLRRLSKEAALRSQRRIQTLISNSRFESEKIKKRR